MIKSISIIGSGNVATHLGRAFYDSGIQIDCIFSRSFSNAENLAKEVGAKPIDELDEIKKTSDLYLICIPDDHIFQYVNLLAQFIPKGSIIAHTSGSTPLYTKNDSSIDHAVFYPLQTFSRNKVIDISKVPFLISSSAENVNKQLSELAKRLSDKVEIISDDQRLHLHIAAVYANNFSNHLFAIAEQILKDQGLDFDLLKPLISETANKVQTSSPSKVQTGPAWRGDKTTIDKHLKELKNNKAFRKVYKEMSKAIRKSSKKEES